jgi:hypothetical protein
MAEIEAYGPEPDLLALAQSLGAPLQITGLAGELLWWGYLDSLQIERGYLSLRVGLDALANRVRVSYMPVLPGPEWTGRRMRTVWAENLESQAMYGIKEYQAHLGQSSAEAALNLRTTLLQTRQFPVPNLNFQPVEQARALLTARGWWQTLAWRYYDQPAGLEQNGANANGLQHCGSPSSQALRQALPAPVYGNWFADKLCLRIHANGNPLDGLVVRLTDAGGNVLSSGSLLAANLPRGGVWTEIDLAPRVMIQAGEVYGLRIERTGTLDAANDYRLDVDNQVCTQPAEFFNGAWNPCNPQCSLVYKLVGLEDSADQMKRILAACGPFFTGLDLPAASGVMDLLWREGENTALTEMEDLLRAGASDGRAYLAGVDAGRRLWIEKIPNAGDADYLARTDGSVLDPYGQPLVPGVCPAGVWVRPLDLGGGLETVCAFIASSQWDAVKGKLSVVTV